MENWKRAVVGTAAGASAVCFLTGRRVAGILFAGVSLATLAAEYPEEFAEIRERIPEYVDRGTHFLDVVTRAGERIAEVTNARGSNWYDAFLRS